MHPCPNVSKPTNLRPPSSVSLLAEQLKSSSLNDTGNVSVGSLWWSQSHMDGIIGNMLIDAPVTASCDVCDSGITQDRPRTGGRYCVLCMCGEPPIRSCDANNMRPTTTTPNVSTTLSTSRTGEVFGISPYAPSSISSQGQSEPEEEDMDPTWRLKQSCEGKPTDLFHHYSASAPTTEPAYTSYNNTTNSRLSFTFNTTCITTSFAPSFSVSPLNQSRATADKLMTGSVYPCTCHAHLLPAKRACRSLSASASAQRSQSHQHHAHYTPGQSRSNRHSQLIEAHLFEAHFSTLPRPIAIRPVPQSGTDSSHTDANTNASGGSISSGLKSFSSGGVMLRTAKPREYTYGSRLSWHHPVFSSGLGAKAQHPSYGVNFACMASHLCTHSSRSVVPTGVPTVAGATGAVNSMSGTSATHSSLCSVDSCSGQISKHQPAEAQPGPCTHCAFPSSPRTRSGLGHNSAFTPTHTRFGSPVQPAQTSDCSLSPDVDLSASSSLQIPVPTPSSGFHEASFSCLSEASSLPDCSRMLESRREFPSLTVNTPHSKAIDTPTVSRRNPCGTSSSCTETGERVQLSESALRCRSQPSEPAAPSTCSADSVNLPNPDELSAPKITPPTISGVVVTTPGTKTTTTTVGLKRRRGPSVDTFDLLDMSGSEAIESNETSWCLSPTVIRGQKYTLSHSPHPNDGTLVRNGRGSAHPDSGSIFSPFGSWSSSATGISPFRPPYTLDGGGNSIAGEVFVFGSASRLEAADTDADLDNGTIKRDHDVTSCRCYCHTCQVCMHSRTVQITSDAPEEEGMCMDEVQNALGDGEVSCARSPAWHSTVSCSRAHSGLSCDATCRAHMFPQLTELSESAEEEKEYETPETITGEESGSQSDSLWKHSFQSSNLKSPSMHEVAFAPIQLDKPVGTDNAYSFIPTTKLGPVLPNPRHPQHAFHLNPAFSCTSEQSALIYGAEAVAPSGSGSGDLLLSLSPTDSDGSEDPDMLSPQLVNREKTNPQSTLSGPCPLSTLPCVGLDLDLIEND